MQTKIETEFKAIDYMRKVRDELSEMIQTDNERFHKELNKTMADFIAKRQENQPQNADRH